MAKSARTFELAIGPGLNQLRGHLLARWPEIRHIEVMTEDDRGQRTGGNVRFVEDGREAADDKFTHVMARLKTAELDKVDTLIAAGIANNRAERIRWALTRTPELPPTSSCGSTPATLNGSRASSNAGSPDSYQPMPVLHVRLRLPRAGQPGAGEDDPARPRPADVRAV